MSRSRVFVLALAFVPPLLAAETPDFYQTDFPPEEWKGRWERVFDRIGKDAVAVVQGAPATNGFIVPRQGNDFYYLCGVETPHSYLLLDGRRHAVTLYLPPRNERLERAEGKVLSAADAELAKRLVGVDAVESTDAMAGDWLGRLPDGAPAAVYAPFAPAEGNAQSRYELVAANTGIAADYWDGRLPREARLRQLLAARYPRAEIKDLTPILDELRAVKSPREIALVQKASRLAGLGLLEAMRSTRPGVFEYQLDAAARYVFLTNGARLDAYRSITASGTDNIANMHYYRNARRLEAGDLVLMDYAPDYHYYVSDIGRVWPVSGRFLPWQRELLGFVLAYRNAVLARIRPGITGPDLLAEAREAMAPVLARSRFTKPAYEAAARKLVETGGGVLSPPVGLAGHDDGAYLPGPLRPGHVFSVDPQLRVPEENLYLRYEDTVVVTEKGVLNFTDFLPSELADIEKAVSGNGLVQRFPADGGS